jgi:hypothetical protein
MTTLTFAATPFVTGTFESGVGASIDTSWHVPNDKLAIETESSGLDHAVSKSEVAGYLRSTIARMRPYASDSRGEIWETEAVEPVEPSKLSTVAPEVSVQSRPRVWPSGAAVYAAPIEIFEGVVQLVDSDAGVMHVTLSAKTRVAADHAAEIAIRWVNEQDRPLVKPGAVFYLSLYRERRGKTVRNTEEIRFRRLPSWTKAQVREVRQDAKRLLGKLTTRPLLDE